MKNEGSDTVKQPPMRQPENPAHGLINDSHHEGTQPEMNQGQVHRIPGNTPGMPGAGSVGKTAGTV